MLLGECTCLNQHSNLAPGNGEKGDRCLTTTDAKVLTVGGREGGRLNFYWLGALSFVL